MIYQITASDLLQISNLELLAKQVVEGFLTGLHKSPYHGFSVEFAEHRQYNSGESTKNLDWKLFARTDKLFVKRFEEETNLRCQLVIDTSSSMFFPTENLSKIKFSAIAAASLIKLMQKQRDASGVTLFHEEIYFHSEAKISGTHQKLLFNQLQQLLLEPNQNKKSNISEALHQLADTLHRRSLIILFSDLGESSLTKLVEAMQHLRYNRHEVILFDVQEKEWEEAFNFENRPYLFKDLETGEEIKLHPNAVKESYLEASHQWRSSIKMHCLQNKIDYNEAIIGNDFNQVLMPFIKKRNA